MAATVAGTFEDQAGAEWAIGRLNSAEIPAANISMVVRHPAAPGEATGGDRGAAPAADPGWPGVDPALAEQLQDDTIEPVSVEEYSPTESGAAAGGMIGALSGFLVGLGVVALPGLGLIVAAGPLAASLSGTAIGAATGGLIGALVEAGVPEEFAATGAYGVQCGHVLVLVQTEDVPPERVREIMLRAGAVNLYPAVKPPS
jgi:hypothetical protein